MRTSKQLYPITEELQNFLPALNNRSFDLSETYVQQTTDMLAAFICNSHKAAWFLRGQLEAHTRERVAYGRHGPHFR